MSFYGNRFDGMYAPALQAMRSLRVDPQMKKNAEFRSNVLGGLGTAYQAGMTGLGMLGGGLVGGLGGATAGGVGALPGAAAGAATGASLGGAIGQVGGGFLHNLGEEELDPVREREMKRQAIMDLLSKGFR